MFSQYCLIDSAIDYLYHITENMSVNGMYTK